MNIKPVVHILTIFFILLTVKAKAQLAIGFEAGVSNNKLAFKDNNNNITLNKSQGYLASIIVDYRLNKWLTIEASPGVLQKNYGVQNKKKISQQITNAYLQLPISIRYETELMKGLTASASFGLYYAYWISSNVDGTVPNVFNLSYTPDGDELISLQSVKYAYQFNAASDNRSEFGGVAKVGLSYRVLKKLSCVTNVHYYQSISDQQKKIVIKQIPKYNQTSALAVGLIYHFD